MKKNKPKKTNFIIKLFKNIVKFLDKILITPISKFVYFITDKLTIPKGTFDKFLNRPNMLIYISLFCAFLTFLLFDTKVINLVETQALVLENKEVTVEYNDEAYVVEGIPEDVDIILMGKTSELYLAEQLGEHKITLDLSDYGVGTHKVSLRYAPPINSLKYKLDPSSITVIVHSKVSEVRTLTKDIINTDKLGETLVVSNVILDRDEVIIKSYEEKLAKVASVKALVDVNTLNATTAGTYTLENVKLVAYDENGTEINDIEVVPNTVTATVTITSPSKEVPIKIVPVGEVASGSAISSIESSVASVIVYADETILSEINFIAIEIDVNNLNEDKVFQKVITKPSGTRSVSETAVTIKVTMEKETSKDFEDVQLEFENLDPSLKALGKSAEDTKVVVSVKGVETLLNKLTSADIKAYVDLEGLGIGEHSVPVYVSGADVKLSYTSKTQKVNIVIMGN